MSLSYFLVLADCVIDSGSVAVLDGVETIKGNSTCPTPGLVFFHGDERANLSVW